MPLILAIVLVFSTVATDLAVADPPHVLFGAMSELTGPGAENGAQCKLGYQIAMDLFAVRHPALAAAVEITYGDHKREQRAGISEFQRFASSGVWAVAANHGLIGAVINPLSKQAGIPLFGVMGHENFVATNPFAVRIIPTPREEGGGLATRAYLDGMRTAAILLLEDDYIIAVGRAFEDVFQKLGGRVVYKDYFVESVNDFGAIASRIRAAKPDALAMTLGFQQFGPAIRRLREQGVAQPVYANYWLSYPSVIASAGGAANLEGSTYITERSDYPEFIAAYERRAGSGEFRSGVVYRCYTALAAALFSLAECPACSDRTRYAGYVAELQALQLPERKISVANREVKFEQQCYRFEEGKPVLRK